MPVAGIASNLPFQSVNQAFFFQRRLDVVELGRAINSGDLTKAQHVYDALAALGQNTNGDKPFKNSTLENDFLAVGQALKTGDAVAAQQAYATLQQAIQKINFGGSTPEIAFNFANGSGNGNSLAEIILNLNNGGSQPPQASGIQINVVV